MRHRYDEGVPRPTPVSSRVHTMPPFRGPRDGSGGRPLADRPLSTGTRDDDTADDGLDDGRRDDPVRSRRSHPADASNVARTPIIRSSPARPTARRQLHASRYRLERLRRQRAAAARLHADRALRRRQRRIARRRAGDARYGAALQRLIDEGDTPDAPDAPTAAPPRTSPTRGRPSSDPTRFVRLCRRRAASSSSTRVTDADDRARTAPTARAWPIRSRKFCASRRALTARTADRVPVGRLQPEHGTAIASYAPWHRSPLPPSHRLQAASRAARAMATVAPPVRADPSANGARRGAFFISRAARIEPPNPARAGASRHGRRLRVDTVFSRCGDDEAPSAAVRSRRLTRSQGEYRGQHQ